MELHRHPGYTLKPGIYFGTIPYAIERYRKETGQYPPAWTLDDDGNRKHSWRALIVPYFHMDMYDSVPYDYDQPWDSPHNMKIEFYGAMR